MIYHKTITAKEALKRWPKPNLHIPTDFDLIMQDDEFKADVPNSEPPKPVQDEWKGFTWHKG